MRVIVDEQTLEVAEPTLAAALDAARRRAESQRRVVVEATIDGLVIPDAALAAPSIEDLGSREVRFVTAEPIALVQYTLRGVSDLMSETKAQQSRAADLLTTGELEQAMQHLASALAAWDSVHQAVLNGAALLGVDAESLRVKVPGQAEAVGVGDQVRELARHLGEIKRSIGVQDWAGLGDTLHYEMQTQAENWRTLLLELSEQLGRPRAS